MGHLEVRMYWVLHSHITGDIKAKGEMVTGQGLGPRATKGPLSIGLSCATKRHNNLFVADINSFLVI